MFSISFSVLIGLVLGAFLLGLFSPLIFIIALVVRANV